MTRISRLFFSKWVLGAASLWILSWYLASIITHIQPPFVTEPQVVSYQVDVVVDTNYIAQGDRGQDSVDGQRCINQRGNVRALSEKGTRNLHLLCIDAEGNLFDIIITKINKFVPKWRNPESFLQNVEKLGKMDVDGYVQYIEHTRNAIEIRLKFNPGDIFFVSPP